MVKRKYVIILISLLITICLYTFSRNIVNNSNRDEEWTGEWLKIIELAENYRIMQQKNILTLNDLRFTYWVPADKSDEREIHWTYAFLNENYVLLFNSYDMTVPSSLIRYEIRDNIIFLAQYLKCYLYDTYLFFGNENTGFIKYKFHSRFSFIDEVFFEVGAQE
ncbi:MAG: hypothetical protein FWC91_14065 [Defluviitaleaceae bacterium]|nr:hypothetical protein [Defluviitaleaceae bacterium]